MAPRGNQAIAIILIIALSDSIVVFVDPAPLPQKLKEYQLDGISKNRSGGGEELNFGSSKLDKNTLVTIQHLIYLVFYGI